MIYTAYGFLLNEIELLLNVDQPSLQYDLYMASCWMKLDYLSKPLNTEATSGAEPFSDGFGSGKVPEPNMSPLRMLETI